MNYGKNGNIYFSCTIPERMNGCWNFVLKTKSSLINKEYCGQLVMSLLGTKGRSGSQTGWFLGLMEEPGHTWRKKKRSYYIKGLCTTSRRMCSHHQFCSELNGEKYTYGNYTYLLSPVCCHLRKWPEHSYTRTAHVSPE